MYYVTCDKLYIPFLLIMPPSRKRKLNKYNRQFIAENTTSIAAERATKRNETGTSCHTHTSVDVTNRLRPLAKTTYFSAPNVNNVPSINVSSTLPSTPTESLNFDFVVEDAYMDYVADTNLNEESPRNTRKRTAGVSGWPHSL